MKVHHINCGTLLVPSYPTVVCHCLLLQEEGRLALVDTGIGMADVRDPVGRLGKTLIEMAGFQFHESDTAVRRIEAEGLSSCDVRHVVLTHGDPDHAGGLADFPGAQVHVAEEEHAHIGSGHGRYVANHFAHGPNWKTYGPKERTWFGMEARPVDIGFSSEVLLIPLFGHTLGHCGVAIQQKEKWLLHVGDAYYLRDELTVEEHPVSGLAKLHADDDFKRRESLRSLRRIAHEHSHEVEMVGYHDLSELPEGYPLPGLV